MSNDDSDLNTLTQLELYVEDGKEDHVKDAIKNLAKIYKVYNHELKLKLNEYLLEKAYRFNHVNIFELLLHEFSTDYTFCKTYLSTNNSESRNLLNCILVVYENDVSFINYLENCENMNSVNFIEFLILYKFYDQKRNYCVVKKFCKADINFLYNLIITNGVLNINYVNNYCIKYLFVKNRLDLLKTLLFQANYKNYDLIEITEYYIKTDFHNLNILNFLFSLNKSITAAQLNNFYELTVHNTCPNVFELILEMLIKKNFEIENFTSENLYNFLKSLFNCEHRIFLHRLIKHKNYKIINYILKYDFNLLCFDQNHETPLHLAISDINFINLIREIINRNRNIIDEIIIKNIDINRSVLNRIEAGTSKLIIELVVSYVTLNKINLAVLVNYAIFFKLIVYELKLSIKHLVKYLGSIDFNHVYNEHENDGDDECDRPIFLAIKLQSDYLFKKLMAYNHYTVPIENMQNCYGDTVLNLACRYGTHFMIQQLIKLYPNLINIPNHLLVTPLCSLIKRNDSLYYDIFEDLVARQADIHNIDIRGNTALQLAVLSNNVIIATKLLQIMQPFACTKNSDGNTALHLAILNEHFDVFKIILLNLHNTNEINTQNKDGNTVLHIASKLQDSEYFNLLYELTPIATIRNKLGQTALHLCYDTDRFKKLLNLSADIKITDNTNHSAYHYYGVEYKIDILIEIFTNHGTIELTRVTDDGLTLLHCLCDLRIPLDATTLVPSVTKLFVKCSNSVEQIRQETPVFKAAINNLNYLQKMFELSEQPIDLEHKNFDGETAIFQTLINKHFNETLKFLLEKGANINAQDNLGETLLFKAELVEITDYLIKHNADVNIVNKTNQTALHRACERNNLSQILLLCNNGADINHMDANNKTPFDLITKPCLNDFIEHFRRLF